MEKLTDYDNRFNSLPLHVQAYIGLSKSLARENIPEATKRELREEQLNLLRRMKPAEITAMSDFIQWVALREQKEKTQASPLFPFEGY